MFTQMLREGDELKVKMRVPRSNIGRRSIVWDWHSLRIIEGPCDSISTILKGWTSRPRSSYSFARFARS